MVFCAELRLGVCHLGSVSLTDRSKQLQVYGFVPSLVDLDSLKSVPTTPDRDTSAKVS